MGASPATASVGYAVGLASFTCGVLVGGRAADRAAPRRLAIGVGMGTSGGLGLTATATTLPLLVVGFGILLGRASGLGYATAAVPPGRFGTAYGVVFSGWGLVGLAGPVAAAWLAFQASYSLVAALLVGVTLLSWAAGTRAPRARGD